MAAARAEFAERGYDGTSLRGVARAAGVDPSLVHHYFSGKEQVFVAAMQLPLHPGEVVPRLVAGDRDGTGERVVRFFLSVWGDDQLRAPFLGMLSAAMTAEPAARMLRQFVGSAVLGPVAEALGGEDAPLRASLAASQLIGLAVLRYVVRVEPLASADEETVVAMVAPTVQRYLVGAPASPS